jgi:hypothetical protein
MSYLGSLLSLSLSLCTIAAFGQKHHTMMPASVVESYPQAGGEVPPDPKITEPDTLNLRQIDSLRTWAIKRGIVAHQINLSLRQGYELLPPHKSAVPDTSNFKPENFSFPIIDRKTLTDILEKDIPQPTVPCKPVWGFFSFRVNAKGQVDSTWYQGNLLPVARDKILSNISATEGRWKIKADTKPQQVAWFVYTYLNVRGIYDKQLNCSEADKVLLRAISSLGNFFFYLYYQIDPKHNRATMLMPTNIDDSPKL